MNKKNLLPAIVLTVICIVVALALGLTNMITKGVIEEQARAKLNESLKAVALDENNYNFEEVTDDYNALPKTVKAVYRDEVGGSYAVTVEKQGYASVISMTVGIDGEGTIIKVIITAQQETHGKPDVAKLPDRFVGVTADTIDEVELVSGATITSNTIKGGVEDALVALGLKDEAPELPRTDAELMAMAKELLSGSTEFTDVTKDSSGLVKRVYRDNGGNGYVVYTHTYASYGGGLETEALVAFNNDREITAVRKLHWVVGHSTEYGPPPPSEATVDAFFQSFVGKSAGEISSVEVIADATGTSNNVIAAITEAAEAVLSASDALPRGDAELVAMAKELLHGSGEFEDITGDTTGLVKRVYRDNGGKGYVVYTHTYASYGGGLETEALIAFDNSGKITAVKKLHWVVGHSTEYGPPPPSEATVDAFFQSFVGKSAGEITTVEVIADATGTSNNVKAAILEAAEAIPVVDSSARIVGIIVLVAILGGTVAIVIVTKRRRGEK